MYQDGTRRKSLFKRVGRPRTTWHTVTRKHTIKQLVDKNTIPPNWDIHMKRQSWIILSSKPQQTKISENFDIISPKNEYVNLVREESPLRRPRVRVSLKQHRAHTGPTINQDTILKR